MAESLEPNNSTRPDNLSDAPDENAEELETPAEEIDEIERMIASYSKPPETVQGDPAPMNVTSGPAAPTPSPPPAEEPIRRGRKPRKKALIEALLKMRETLGDVIPDEKKLKRMRVTELRSLIQRMVQMSGLSNTPPATIGVPPPPVSSGPAVPPPATVPAGTRATQAVAQQQTVSKMRPEHLMFAGTGAVISSLETISKVTADYTSFEIDGWKQEFFASQAEMLPILAGVWQEHSQVIGPYLTPTGVFALALLSQASAHVKPKKNGYVERAFRKAPIQSGGPPASQSPPS